MVEKAKEMSRKAGTSYLNHVLPFGSLCYFAIETKNIVKGAPRYRCAIYLGKAEFTSGEHRVGHWLPGKSNTLH